MKLLFLILFPSIVFAQTPLKMLIRKTPPPGFSPTDISGLKFWVKADQLSASDGDPVGTWTDLSGVGNTVTASSSARPTYKTSIQNNKPIVRFDGSDDVMNKASFSGIDGVAGMTIFIVVKQPTLTTNNIYVSKWDYQTQGTFAWQTDQSTSSELKAYIANACNDNGSNNMTSTDASLTTNFFLLELVYDGSQSNASRVKFYRNTTLLSTSVSGTIPTTLTSCTADFRVGSFGGSLTRYFTGDIGEIIIYDSALSGGNRASVESYLNSRWAIY